MQRVLPGSNQPCLAYVMWEVRDISSFLLVWEVLGLSCGMEVSDLSGLYSTSTPQPFAHLFLLKVPTCTTYFVV